MAEGGAYELCMKSAKAPGTAQWGELLGVLVLLGQALGQHFSLVQSINQVCAGKLGVQHSAAHAEYRNFMPMLHYTLWTRLLLLLGKSFSVFSAEAGICRYFCEVA